MKELLHLHASQQGSPKNSTQPPSEKRLHQTVTHTTLSKGNQHWNCDSKTRFISHSFSEVTHHVLAFRVICKKWNQCPVADTVILWLVLQISLKIGVTLWPVGLETLELFYCRPTLIVQASDFYEVCAKRKVYSNIFLNPRKLFRIV